MEETYPERAEEFRRNAADYIARLEELDATFRDITENAKRKTIIFGDRFPFRYLADEYGLKYYAAFPGCSSESEPGVKTVAFLIDKIKSENLPAVFYIEFSNMRTADALAEDTGAAELLLHSCHSVTREELDSGVGYIELMEQNAENLKIALN
jgi:zinc transport system substrate-binding protein